jgi:prepilin-type N-terminal cleavage/methylation domain-containing protein
MSTQSRRAFTLIEILTVVVIIAVTSAVIIPALGSRDDLKAAAGARVVMADLIWAQNRAISTQQKQYVIFNGQSYTLWYKDSTGTLQQSTNPITKNTYTTTFGVANTPMQTVSISGTPNFASKGSLEFDEMGTPYGWDGTTEYAMASAGTIRIVCGTQSLTISIEPYTGEASVQ